MSWILRLSPIWLAVACGPEAPAPSEDTPPVSTTASTNTSTTSDATSDGTTGVATTASGGAESTGAVASTSGTGNTTAGGATQGTTTGGSSTGGATTSSGGGGAEATAGTAGTSSGGGGVGQVCEFECVADCALLGGTEQTGSCSSGTRCCQVEDPPDEDPLDHLRASAQEIGLLLANRFSQQALSFSSVQNLPGDGYKTACEWYGALGVASLTNDQGLLGSLISKFDPLKGDFVSAMSSGDAHVDRYIFGMVPLEIYLQTGDASCLPLGTQTADTQQVTNQTRGAIDDMFMMTGLQLEAYRATGDAKYIDFMASTMVDYLGAQQQNGLFVHNVSEAPVEWGRGNGWFAAGMAEMMRDLPPSHANYSTILAGYTKMMQGLLAYQGDNGLWYQVVDMPDDPNNWEESSASAMFTYAMIAGVRRGVLDGDTYVPVIDAAWNGLLTKISGTGDVSDICAGTWYHATAQEYMTLNRLTGDGHGQAPVLWAAAELLR